MKPASQRASRHVIGLTLTVLVTLAMVLISCRGDRDGGGWAHAGGLRFRSDSQCLRLVGPGRLELTRTDQPCGFEIESEKRLVAVVLDLAAEAPTQIEIQGGSAGVRLFRPDGTVVVQVLLDAPAEAERLKQEPTSYRYPLRLGFPRGDGLPLRLTWAPEEAAGVDG